MKPWAVLGVPIDSVGRSGGTEHGPEAMRELGLIDALAAEDRGDLEVRIRGEKRDPDSGIIADQDVLATTSAVRARVAEEIAAGRRPLLAGGCCAELPGALAGARDELGRIGLVHVDGHLDLYDGVTSPTGEAADMPVAVALGRGPETWVEAAGGPSVAPGDVAIVGYRDQEESRGYGMLQPEELTPEPIHLSVYDVRERGAKAAGAAVVTALGQTPFWLHLDVDVLDQEVFPATDYLLPNGMSWDELMPVLASLGAAPSLIGVSVACYNPEKDPNRACGRTLIDTLNAAFVA